MSDQNAETADGLGLAEAIALLRDDLLRARAAGAAWGVQLPVDSMTVVLTVTATKSVDGGPRFMVPVVGAGLREGGDRTQRSEQTVTVVFGAPVDSDGLPVKVASASDVLKG
jgi:hypothetical protein